MKSFYFRELGNEHLLISETPDEMPGELSYALLVNS